MRMPVHPAPRHGLSLIGLLSWAIVVGFVGYLLVRAVPTVNEYYAIQGIVNRLAANPPSTVAEIRRAFDRQKSVDQTVSSVSGSELAVTKENERVVISFAYEKEIELIQPVYLLIKYKGRSQ